MYDVQKSQSMIRKLTRFIRDVAITRSSSSKCSATMASPYEGRESGRGGQDRVRGEHCQEWYYRRELSHRHHHRRDFASPPRRPSVWRRRRADGALRCDDVTRRLQGEEL